MSSDLPICSAGKVNLLLIPSSEFFNIDTTVNLNFIFLNDNSGLSYIFHVFTYEYMDQSHE